MEKNTIFTPYCKKCKERNSYIIDKNNVEIPFKK